MKWILILFLVLSSCRGDRKALVDPIIQMRIESRVKEFQDLEYQKCREKILEQAIQKVDSLLRENPVMIHIDTMGRPKKPQKPQEPTLLIPKDTVPLKPLIN